MLFHVSYIVMKLKKKFVHLHFYNCRLEWWQILFSWNYVMLKARKYLAICIQCDYILYIVKY